MTSSSTKATSVTGRGSRAVPPGEGTFIDHLEELRRRVLLVLLLFVVASVVAFSFIDSLFALLLLPFGETPIGLIAVRPQEKFVTYVQLAAFVGAVAAVPLFLFQLARFVRPALEASERRSFAVAHAAAQLFFLAGVGFAVFIVAPFALAFFRSFAEGDGVVPMWSVGEYVKLLRGIVIAITIVFQTPIVMFLFTSAGIVSTSTLRRFRRHAVVVSALAGAFLSPPDVFTQLLVGGTLYALYELTLFVSRLYERPGTEDRES